MSKTKRDPYKDKADFLTELISMDKDQINQYIKENGKPVKRYNPFIVMGTKLLDITEEKTT